MNPLSAFSFGQLIKTFLPGLIASAAPLLVFEALYQWKHPAAPASWLDVLRQSFTYRVLSPNLAGSITLLVLVALLLGFALNSLHWVLFHSFCRKRCVSPPLEEAKKELERKVRNALEEVLPGRYQRPEPSLPGFFLALVDLPKHSHLRESYFAWYEFHMNALSALGLVLLTFVGTSFALTAHWQIGWRSELRLVLAVAAVFALSMAFLWVAALRNLRTYEERYFWFLIGTLHALRAEAPAAAAPAAGTVEETTEDPWWVALAASVLRRRLRPPG